MKIFNIYILQLLLLSLLPTILFTSCDKDGEESIDWRPGESLMIAGPAAINTLSRSSYYVRTFTTNKTYSWTLEGPSGTVDITRGSEFANVIAEAPGTYTLTVNNGTHSGSLTITVSSGSQVLSFEPDSMTVPEIASDTVFIPVVINSRNTSETVVDFSISGGTATEGVDYEVVTTSPLTFGVGETFKEIKVVIISDVLREEDETIILSLNEIVSTGTGEYATILYTPGEVGDPDLTTIVVTIEDDVKFISFEPIIMDTLTNVTDAGNYVFNVMLSEPAGEDVTVPYTVNGIGVTPASGTVTFPATVNPQDWAVSQPLSVNISEAAFAANQTITITLGDPVSIDEEVEFETDEEEERIGNVMEIYVDVED